MSLRSDKDCLALQIHFQDLLDYTDKNPVLASRLEQYIEQMEDVLKAQNVDLNVHRLSLSNNM